MWKNNEYYISLHYNIFIVKNMVFDIMMHIEKL